jgi:para-aminobenzoate synthetase component I
VWAQLGNGQVHCPLDWDLAPAEVLRLVRADAYPVALWGDWAGGGGLVASAPVQVRCPPAPIEEVFGSQSAAGWPGACAPAPLGAPGTEPAGADEGPGFGAGWIGYLGFGLASEFLPVPPAPGSPRRLPAWWFGYYDHVLRRDQATGRWSFEALVTPGRADALRRRFSELNRRAQAGDSGPREYSCGEFRLVPSPAEHRAAVSRAVELIHQGDIFQANICLRLEAGFDGDPLDAFCRAADRLRPPFAAFVGLREGAVASLSPELFLRRRNRTVLSRPIKGTRYRAGDDQRADRQRRDLERSAKDRAENVMIVDLMRNDLSRVCAVGSVEVPRLTAAEPHPGVWHLVSDVRGTLRADRGDGDLIRATFPPGSVTGAPKVRAMEVIHELEATAREVYTGAVGYRSPLAGLELNVAIRTFEFHRGQVWLGSGGGIVADSRDDDEYQECLLKARPLIDALGGRLADEAGHGTAGPQAGAIPAASAFTGTDAAEPPTTGDGNAAALMALRPRPAAGVFTSLLVADGVVRDLPAHQERLSTSTRELFGKDLPASLHDDLAACLAAKPSGRLRITARPVSSLIQATAEVVPLDRQPRPVDLHPAVIPGGLGAHKWLDRRLLSQLSRSQSLSAGAQLLIEDTDGAVLETDRANVFAVLGGVLHTPAADGRLLPGVTRAAVLHAAAREGIPVHVAPMTRAQMLTASEVFLTNAVHAILPVRSLAGTPTEWVAGPMAGHLAALLGNQPPECAIPAPRRAVQPAPARLTPKAGTRPATLVIDNYDSFTYNLVHLLQASGCDVEVVRNDEVPAEQILASGPAGIVISPGPCSPADAGISVEVVRANGGTIPLLGICLGHQAIAAAFGARIIRAPKPVHGQTARIRHDGRGVLSGLPQDCPATRYHSLIVAEDSLPSCLAVTARTSRGRLPMGLRHATQPIEGVQFHPESILTPHGQAIISNFAQIIAAVRITDPEGSRPPSPPGR